jgi:hypothetical protein
MSMTPMQHDAERQAFSAQQREEEAVAAMVAELNAACLDVSVMRKMWKDWVGYEYEGDDSVVFDDLRDYCIEVAHDAGVRCPHIEPVCLTEARAKATGRSYRCEWLAGYGDAEPKTVDAAFFCDQCGFTDADALDVLLLDVGAVNRIGGAAGELMTVTRLA